MENLENDGVVVPQQAEVYRQNEDTGLPSINDVAKEELTKQKVVDTKIKADKDKKKPYKSSEDYGMLSYTARSLINLKDISDITSDYNKNGDNIINASSIGMDANNKDYFDPNYTKNSDAITNTLGWQDTSSTDPEEIYRIANGISKEDFYSKKAELDRRGEILLDGGSFTELANNENSITAGASDAASQTKNSLMRDSLLSNKKIDISRPYTTKELNFVDRVFSAAVNSTNALGGGVEGAIGDYFNKMYGIWGAKWMNDLGGYMTVSSNEVASKAKSQENNGVPEIIGGIVPMAAMVVVDMYSGGAITPAIMSTFGVSGYGDGIRMYDDIKASNNETGNELERTAAGGAYSAIMLGTMNALAKFGIGGMQKLSKIPVVSDAVSSVFKSNPKSFEGGAKELFQEFAKAQPGVVKQLAGNTAHSIATMELMEGSKMAVNAMIGQNQTLNDWGNTATMAAVTGALFSLTGPFAIKYVNEANRNRILSQKEVTIAMDGKNPVELIPTQEGWKGRTPDNKIVEVTDEMYNNSLTIESNHFLDILSKFKSSKTIADPNFDRSVFSNRVGSILKKFKTKDGNVQTITDSNGNKNYLSGVDENGNIIGVSSTGEQSVVGKIETPPLVIGNETAFGTIVDIKDGVVIFETNPIEGRSGLIKSERQEIPISELQKITFTDPESKIESAPLGIVHQSIINEYDKLNGKSSDNTYDANDNAIKSLSSHIEDGGFSDPTSKYGASIIPKIISDEKVSGIFKSAISSSLNNITSTLSSGKLSSNSISKLINRLLDNPIENSANSTGIWDKMFDSIESDQNNNSTSAKKDSKNRKVTAASTIGIFAGSFGSNNPFTYGKAFLAKNIAMKKLESMLGSKFGMSDSSISKFKDVLNNTPVANVDAVIDTFTKRMSDAYISDRNSDKSNISNIDKLSGDLRNVVASYISNHLRMAGMTSRLPKGGVSRTEFLAEAIQPIESELSAKTISRAINETSGRLDKVFVHGIQQEAFLVSGANIGDDGKLQYDSSQDGKEVPISVLIPKSGNVVQIRKSDIQSVVSSDDPADIAEEMSMYNTKRTIDSIGIDALGINNGLNKPYSDLKTQVNGSENRNIFVKFGSDGDIFNPHRVNPKTGKLGTWQRMKSADDGTYEYVDLDENGGSQQDLSSLSKSTGVSRKPDVSATASIDESGKITESYNIDDVPKFRYDEEDGSEYEDDGVQEERTSFVESNPFAKEIGIPSQIVPSEEAVELESKPIRKSNDIPSTIKDNLSGLGVDDLVASTSSDDISRSVGDIESVFESKENVDKTSEISFVQKYLIGNNEIKYEEDSDELSFLSNKNIESDQKIDIKKLKRDRTKRLIDRKADVTAKTLVFINTKEKGYRADGRRVDTETSPLDNSKILLDGDWFDNSEISISTAPLETNVDGRRYITRAPLITVKDPATGKELLFTLKSPRILKAMLESKRMTPDEYNRAISLYTNIVNAVKSGSSINLAVAIGKPKMTSFRQSRQVDENGAPIKPLSIQLSLANSGEFKLDKNDFNFCFRFEGILYSYSKGSNKAEMTLFANSVGSSKGSSISMHPPVVQNSERDYTPAMGPVIDSNSKASVIAEIIQSDNNALIRDIIEAYGEKAIVPSDKLLYEILPSSSMTVGEFKDMFLSNDLGRTDGIYLVGNVLYVGKDRLGRTGELQPKEIETAIINKTLNIDISAFFSEDMSIRPISESLKLDKEYTDGDLHDLLYDAIVTTDLEQGLYDPPFLFIAEKDEFENEDINQSAQVTINGTRVPNVSALPQEAINALNDIYEKRIAELGNISGDLSVNDILRQISESTDNSKVEFKVSDTPNIADNLVAHEITMASIKWLAKGVFNANIITDKAEIDRVKLDIFNNLENNNNIKPEAIEDYKKILNGKVKGFKYNGNIYLSAPTSESAGHELGHFVFDCIDATLNKKDRDAFRASITRYGSQYPSEINAIRLRYGFAGDPYIEFFCDSFGFAFDKNINDRNFRTALSHMYIGFVNSVSKLFGTDPARYSAKAYNGIVKYAFRSSVDDFVFINNIFNSNKLFRDRLSSIASFSTKGNISSSGFPNEIMAEIDNIRRSSLSDGTFMKKPDGSTTNLNMSDWLFTKTSTFKKAFSGSTITNGGEPIKLYVNPDDITTAGFISVTTKQQNGGVPSGFLSANGVLRLSDEQLSEIQFDPSNLYSAIDDMSSYGLDAASYEFGGETYYIIKDVDKFISSSITDSSYMFNMYDNGRGSRLSKAKLMYHAILSGSKRYDAASIVASTGFHIVEYNGEAVAIEIKFSDEYINNSAVKNAIESGASVDIRSLYKNEELLNSILKKDIKARIRLTDNVDIPKIEYHNGEVIVNINNVVRSVDYKHIFRDVLFSIADNQVSLFGYTPFYMYSNTTKSNGVTNELYDESNRITIVNSKRNSAIDMWNDVISKNISGDQLEAERDDIFSKTGWKILNSNSMISSGMIDFNSIKDKLSDIIRRQQKTSFSIKDVIPEYLYNIINRDVKVLFYPDSGKDTMYYDESADSIMIPNSYLSKSSDGKVSLIKDKVDLTSGFIHELSHSFSRGMFNDNIDGYISIAPNIKLNKEIESYMDLANKATDKRTAAMNIAVYDAVETFMIMHDNGNNTLSKDDILSIINNSISRHKSDIKGSYLKVKNKDKDIIIGNYIRAISTHGASAYISSISEAAGAASEGNLFFSPLLRSIKSLSPSLVSDQALLFTDKKYFNKSDLESYNTVDLDKELPVFSISDVNDAVSDGEVRSKPSMTTTDAFDIVSVDIMNRCVSQVSSIRNIRQVADRSLKDFLSMYNIDGKGDIHSLVNQFVSDFTTAIQSTATDFISIINFIPYEYNKRRGIVDQKKLKNYLFPSVSKASNVNILEANIEADAISGNPFSKGILKMASVAKTLGVTNFYERIYTYFDQKRTVFTDSMTFDKTNEQLAINSFSAIKRINSLKQDMPVELRDRILNEAINDSGPNSDSTDGIITFLERYGMFIDKRTADEYAREHSDRSISDSLRRWDTELRDSGNNGISTISELGTAIVDIVNINNKSESASIKKNGSTYPAMTKHNSISMILDRIVSMTNDEINQMVQSNPYMVGSRILKAIKSGMSLELRKQLDEFSTLGDASLSDIVHILSGYIPMGKISTDGTRYYIVCPNVLDATISVNSDMEIDRSISENDVIQLDRFSVNKKIDFDQFFNPKLGNGRKMIELFGSYAYAEALSVLSAHKTFSNDKLEKISGYHIKGSGDSATPGDGCYFSELMDGVSLSLKADDSGIGETISGTLNDVLRILEAAEDNGTATYDSLYPEAPVREAYREGELGDRSYNNSVEVRNEFVREIDESIDNGYIDKKGAFSRLMIKKMLMFGNVSISQLKAIISKDATDLIGRTDISQRLEDLGILKADSSFDVVAEALLKKRVSEIEVSKVVFGNPQEYGSIKKLEKRTQSFATTFSRPVKYAEDGIRPGGEHISPEFADNTFRCKFAKDLAKENVDFEYQSALDTPGTVIVSPYLYREMMIRARGWSNEAEDEFANIMRKGKSGGDFDSISSKVKFSPLKLIYCDTYKDANGEDRRCLIKAQFVPLFSDAGSKFGNLYEDFTNPDLDKRLHMYAMEDSVKAGFIDGGQFKLDLTSLGMISIPRDTKPKTISMLRKLLLFSDANFNSAIESISNDKLSNLADQLFNANGVIDISKLNSVDFSESGSDTMVAIDTLAEMQKNNPNINPLDFVGMFEVIANKINGRIADAFDIDMKGVQCSAISERLFTDRELKFTNDEGTMDVMVPLEYFDDQVKGLTYGQAVEKLNRLGYMNGKLSNTIVARNPIQSPGSISPAKIVGVFPRSYGYCISAPSEFLNANGGDYDGDKYFLFPINKDNAPEANKMIFDMLLEERKTTSSNVDAEVKRFEDANERIRKSIDNVIKNLDPEKAAIVKASLQSGINNRYTYTYTSEVSGLGLVGVCVNMISGLLTYVRNDISLEDSKGKLVRTEAEIKESLSAVSGLFSLAVDIATNPMLQELGADIKKFRMAFSIAALTDIDTCVSFMNSRLSSINPSSKSGNFNFKIFTDKTKIKEIIANSISADGIASEVSDDEKMFVNTISRFATIFSTLKHANDFYDYVRSSGYFDSIIQSEKIVRDITRIEKSNSSLTSFRVSRQTSSGISNANKKIKNISDMLSLSSDFMNKDVILKMFESISKVDDTSYSDSDGYDTLYNTRDNNPYETFKTKIILNKIINHVSRKIGSSYFNKNFNKKRVSEVRKYMRDEFNISFVLGPGYIHSVTASSEMLYNMAEKYWDNPYVADFFRMYYASASQRAYFIEKNNEIRIANDNAFMSEFGDAGELNDYYKLPGAIISLTHAVKFGVYLEGANTLSKSDFNIIGNEFSKPNIFGSLDATSLIKSIRPIKSDANGNNIINIEVNSTVPMSNGDIVATSKTKIFNIKGEYTKQTLMAIKDLLYSIENKLPIITTNLSNKVVKLAIDAIVSQVTVNGDISNRPVHVVSSNEQFAMEMASGNNFTYSENILDATPGSIVIMRNFNDITDYAETVDNGFEMDIVDLAESNNLVILSVNPNIQSMLSYGDISTRYKDPDIKTVPSKFEDVALDYPGFIAVNADPMLLTQDTFKLASGMTVAYTETYAKKTTYPTFISSKVDSNGEIWITLSNIDGEFTIKSSSTNFIETNIDLAFANRKMVQKALIFTSDASRLNTSRFYNISEYRIVELNADNHPVYKKRDISDNQELNKKCTK